MGGMKKVLNRVSSSYEVFEADGEDDVIPTQSNPFRAPSIAEIYKVVELDVYFSVLKIIVSCQLIVSFNITMTLVYFVN